MALTQGYDVYAALAYTGVQKFLDSVYLARPHYFNYATPAAGGGSSNVGAVSPISIPGSSATIDFKLTLTEPQIYFFPDQFPTTPASVAPPSPLPLIQNQFGIYLTATMCLLVGSTNPPTLICATIGVWTVGHPSAIVSGKSTFISLSVDQVLTSGTGDLGPLLQYILQQILNALLANLQIPASIQGAISFKLTQGPQINGVPAGTKPGQLQVWGGLS